MNVLSVEERALKLALMMHRDHATLAGSQSVLLDKVMDSAKEIVTMAPDSHAMTMVEVGYEAAAFKGEQRRHVDMDWLRDIARVHGNWASTVQPAAEAPAP